MSIPPIPNEDFISKKRSHIATMTTFCLGWEGGGGRAF